MMTREGRSKLKGILALILVVAASLAASVTWSAWQAEYGSNRAAAVVAPTLLSPANGATISNNTPALDWSDVTDTSGIGTYLLYVGSDPGFSSLVAMESTGTASEYTFPSALTDSTYYWEVYAQDNAGNWSSTPSAIWAFTVDTVAPAVPTLLSPHDAGYMRNTTPRLDWSDVTDPSGVSYRLQLDNLTVKVDVSEYTVAAPLDDGAHYWRVRSEDGAGNHSNYTSYRHFHVDTLPPTVTLTSTATSPTNTSPIPMTATFSQARVTGFEVGDIVVGNGTAGDLTVVSNTADTGTVYTFSVTPAGQGVVTVDVPANVAKDGAGNGNTAATQFSITYDTSTSSPVVTTTAATAVGTTAATLNGNLSDRGTASSIQVSFEWGTTTGYGTTTTLQDMNSNGAFSFALTSGLAPGTTYHFRAKADGDGSTVYGDDMIFATLADTTAPEITTINCTDVTAGGATITWSTNEAATSRVEYGITEEYGLFTTLDTNLVTNHSVGLTGLTRFTTYHYRVISKDVGNNEIVSEDCTFRTLDLTDPVISEVNAVDITAISVTITWTTGENATSVVDCGLTIEYGMTATDNLLVTAHTINLTGLTSETTYHYRVKSKDASNNEAQSVDATFTTLDITAPVISSVTPTNITATGATITWTTDEVADSQVEYGLTTSYGSTTTLDSSLVTSHSVNLTGLSSFKTYHFRVNSIDAGDNPVTSADLTFTTTDVTAPTTSVVTDDGDSTTDLTQLHASWTSSDADSGITEYQYAIGTMSGGTDIVYWTSVGTNTAVTKTGLDLSAGTTYYFSVKAKNGQGLRSEVGSSDGISAEKPTGGGMPAWGWALIGIAVVAAVSGAGSFLFRRLTK